MTAESITEQSDALRARLRSMWAAVAPAWGENTEYLDTRGAGITERMLELAALRRGERVLELASGPGSVGLAAAGFVGPEGEVVLSDVVPEMTAFAEARSAGLPNVRTCVLDLEEIDEPDGSYDVVLCREGLMLVPDPARAAGEILRVLRPGGRAAVAVWGPRERNPWLGLVFDVASEQLGTPMPPPGVPHPFSLDDAGQLAGVLSAAGLADVTVGEVDAPYVATSTDEWWERSSSLAGPLAQKLAELPEPARQALRERAAAAVAEYRTGDGLELPGVALVAFARR
jgi:SAM-dependent methyltransferase